MPASKKESEEVNIASVTGLLSEIITKREAKDNKGLIELLPAIKDKIVDLRDAQDIMPSAVNIPKALRSLYEARDAIEKIRGETKER